MVQCVKLDGNLVKKKERHKIDFRTSETFAYAYTKGRRNSFIHD
jgi:hypothetical protein